MRQIGTLPRELDPNTFGDYLLTLGMKSRFDDRPEGWLFWIYDEDHMARARSELEAYLKHPSDPRFGDASATAQKIRGQEKELEKEYRQNYREVADQWAAPGLRRRPLTTFLVVLCVSIYIFQNMPEYSDRIADRLGFFSFMAGRQELRPWRGFTDIANGQVWRLVTPTLMHFGLMGIPLIHLLFNMGWLSALGTMIEVRRGTLTLAILFLVVAVLSNLSEYVYMDHHLNEYYLFGGMSGVVYGLFGYVWMKGLYYPDLGMALQPGSVNIMLIWLVLCMTGALGQIANAAHTGGLITGIVLGVSAL